MDLATQLTHFYGPEPALDVARKTLKRADVRDVAARLKEQQLQRERGSLGPYPSIPSRLGRVPGRRPPSFPLPPEKPRKLHPQIHWPQGWDTGCP